MNTEIEKNIEIFKDNPRQLTLDQIIEVADHFEKDIRETSESLELANQQKNEAEKRKIEAEQKEKEATEKYRKAHKLQEDQYGEVIKELFEEPKKSLQESTRKESKHSIRVTLLVTLVTIICSTFINLIISQLFQTESNRENKRIISNLKEIKQQVSSNTYHILSITTKSWKEPVTKMEFAWVSNGSFDMGSNSGDNDEKPVHRVNLDGFWIGKYEVTNGQFRRYKPEHNSGKGFNDDNQPVVKVSWNEAKEFVKWLSKQNNGKYEFRLPTEAEWEYACRAGTDTRYYTGYTEEDLKKAGWYYENSGSKTRPAGEKEPNAFGLYDMHGNVWEWCGDWYGDYPKQSVTNPAGPDSGSDRVLRGGSWINSARHCRSAYRNRNVPGNRDFFVGFRVLRSLPL